MKNEEHKNKPCANEVNTMKHWEHLFDPKKMEYLNEKREKNCFKLIYVMWNRNRNNIDFENGPENWEEEYKENKNGPEESKKKKKKLVREMNEKKGN